MAWVASAGRKGAAGTAGHAMKAVAGVLPEGFVSTQPIVRLVRDWAPPRAAARDRRHRLRHRRTSFGRPGAPEAELAAAVAAPCAIPGCYRPVRITGRRYVDGGVHTVANLDLVVGERLVICLNALSSRPGSAHGVYWPVRTLLHQQLVPQMRAVERAGVRLVVRQPDRRSIELIGLDPMSQQRVEKVGVAAALEVQQYLQRASISGKLAGLGPAAAAAGGGRRSVSRSAEYGRELGRLADWEPYLREHSGLPGPSANPELAQAVADVGDLALIQRFAGSDDEYLAACGCIGLGGLAAEGHLDLLPRLRRLASDPHWRVREESSWACRGWAARTCPGC